MVCLSLESTSFIESSEKKWGMFILFWRRAKPDDFTTDQCSPKFILDVSPAALAGSGFGSSMIWSEPFDGDVVGVRGVSFGFLNDQFWWMNSFIYSLTVIDHLQWHCWAIRLLTWQRRLGSFFLSEIEILLRICFDWLLSIHRTIDEYYLTVIKRGIWMNNT